MIPETNVPLRICAILTGGSTTETVALVQRALETERAVDMTVVDILNFYWRNPGAVTYPCKANYVQFGPDQCAMRTRVNSSSLNLILNGGMSAFRKMIAYARRILVAADPDVVVICRDRLYAEVAIIRAAQSLNIPTVLVQEGPFCIIGHGASNRWNLKIKYMLAPIAERLGLLPKVGDYGHAGHHKILAASEAYADRWERSGISRAQIAITGVPRYDALKDIKEQVLLTGTSRAPRIPRVYFLVQPFAKHGKVAPAAADLLMREAGRGFTQANVKRPFELIVRMHPRGTTQDCAALVETLNMPYKIQLASEPFTSILDDIDIVVGFYSSAILEALPCGIKAVCLRLPPDAYAEPGEGAKQDVIAATGVPVANNGEALSAALVETLDSASPSVTLDLIYDEIGALTGNAASAVAHEIQVVASRNTRGSVAAC